MTIGREGEDGIQFVAVVVQCKHDYFGFVVL